MYNHKPKSNAQIRKNHKTADRKEGVNLYSQPDRKISVFFLTTSLRDIKKIQVNSVYAQNYVAEWYISM